MDLFDSAANTLQARDEQSLRWGSGQMMVSEQETEIYKHLEQAGRIAEGELESDTRLDNIQTKSWHIRKAAEAAEIAGWPRQAVARRLLEIIEENNYNISRRLVYHVCSPLGYTGNGQAGQKSAMVAQPDSSIEEIQSDEQDYALANEREIRIVSSVIDFLANTVRPRLKSGPYASRILLTDEVARARGELEHARKNGDPASINSATQSLQELERRAGRNSRMYDDDCFAREQLLRNAVEAWDSRYTVNTFQQHELLKLVQAHNVAGAAQAFQAYVKEISLTPKQTHKYKAGEIRDLLPIYDPKDRDEAILAGYYGVQCTSMVCKRCGNSMPPESGTLRCSAGMQDDLGSRTGRKCGSTGFEPCASWRVKLDRGGGTKLMLHCFACLATFKPVTLALPQTSDSKVIDEKMREMFEQTYPQWKKENKID